MLPTEYLLHLVVAQVADECHTPIAQPLEQISRHLTVGVNPGIAQAGQYLVGAVERHPSAILLEGGQVAAVQSCPYLVDGLSANEPLHAIVTVGIGILAILHHAQHIVQPALHL